MVGPMVAQVPVTGSDTQPIKAEKCLTAAPPPAGSLEGPSAWRNSLAKLIFPSFFLIPWFFPKSRPSRPQAIRRDTSVACPSPVPLMGILGDHRRHVFFLSHYR